MQRKPFCMPPLKTVISRVVQRQSPSRAKGLIRRSTTRFEALSRQRRHKLPVAFVTGLPIQPRSIAARGFVPRGRDAGAFSLMSSIAVCAMKMPCSAMQSSWAGVVAPRSDNRFSHVGSGADSWIHGNNNELPSVAPLLYSWRTMRLPISTRARPCRPRTSCRLLKSNSV